VYSQSRAGGDPSEVFALREYRDGDMQNRIHWKLSSRSDEFIVKEPSEQVNSRVLIIPDLPSCKTDADADGVLDVFASISYFLARERLPYSALMFIEELSESRICDEEGLDGFLSGLVTGMKDANKDPCALLEYFDADVCARAAYAHVIFISASVNAAVLREIERICNAERLSVICLDRREADGEDESGVSDAVLYRVSSDGFFDDLASFAI
jgi:hypothetical protein